MGIVTRASDILLRAIQNLRSLCVFAYWYYISAVRDGGYNIQGVNGIRQNVV